VKGASRNVWDAKSAKAGAHLSGRPSRKCQGENPLGIYHSDINSVSQTMGDGARFSGTCTCNDTDWSANGGRNSALFSIERSKNFFC
jgi:hypothetical protein